MVLTIFTASAFCSGVKVLLFFLLMAVHPLYFRLIEGVHWIGAGSGILDVKVDEVERWCRAFVSGEGLEPLLAAHLEPAGAEPARGRSRRAPSGRPSRSPGRWRRSAE